MEYCKCQKTGNSSPRYEKFSGDTLAPELKSMEMGRISRSGRYFVNHYGDFFTWRSLDSGLAILNLADRTRDYWKLVMSFKSWIRYTLTSRSGGTSWEQELANRIIFCLRTPKFWHPQFSPNKLLIVNLPSAEPRESRTKKRIGSWLKKRWEINPKRQIQWSSWRKQRLENQELMFGPWDTISERGLPFWAKLARQDKKEGT